jgi:hypothetical protein
MSTNDSVSAERNSAPKRARGASEERIRYEMDQVSGTLEPRSVTVRLATIVPLLLDAVEQNRAWLSDFADDTVRLDADLFEVLLAYQELRAEAAA